MTRFPFGHKDRQQMRLSDLNHGGREIAVRFVLEDGGHFPEHLFRIQQQRQMPQLQRLPRLHEDPDTM